MREFLHARMNVLTLTTLQTRSFLMVWEASY